MREAGEGERMDLQYCCRVSPLCAEKYKCSICYLEITVTGQYLFDFNIIVKLDCVGLDAYGLERVLRQFYYYTNLGVEVAHCERNAGRHREAGD